MGIAVAALLAAMSDAEVLLLCLALMAAGIGAFLVLVGLAPGGGDGEFMLGCLLLLAGAVLGAAALVVR